MRPVPDEIRTGRLLLRPHRASDADAFVAFMVDADATRHMAFTAEQRTEAGARELLEQVIDSYGTGDAILSLTIADAATDRYLGACGAWPDGDGFEIYYTVVPAEQGRGVATEAVRALASYLFETTPAARLNAYVMTGNAASIRVARRLGFVDAGPARREAAAGALAHEAHAGRRYVLAREDAGGR